MHNMKNYYSIIIVIITFLLFSGCASTEGIFDKSVPINEQCVLILSTKYAFDGKFDGHYVNWDDDVIIPAGIHTFEKKLYEKIGSETYVQQSSFFNPQSEFIGPQGYRIDKYLVVEAATICEFEPGKYYRLVIEFPEIIITEVDPGPFQPKRIGNSYVSPDLFWPQYEAGWTYSNTFAPVNFILKGGLTIVNNKIDMRIDAVGAMGAGLRLHNIDRKKPLSEEDKKEYVSLVFPYYFGLMTDFNFRYITLGIGGGLAGLILTNVPEEANPPEAEITPFIQGTVSFYHDRKTFPAAGHGLYMRFYPGFKNPTAAFGVGYLHKFQ